MTLVQLKYLDVIAACGSLHGAARELGVSQPSLSKAVAALEQEMGIVIFGRTRRGLELTAEGVRFMGYARSVLEQADVLRNAYSGDHRVRRMFAVSSQHYAFVVNAFITLIRECRQDDYEFSLREERTSEIIADVAGFRSDLGIIYLSGFNEELLLHTLSRHNLHHEFLLEAAPHVFVGHGHPLAQRRRLTFEDLEGYPRFYYDQGLNSSFYLAEELHAERQVAKNVVVTDRATLYNLLIGLNGYTIASGILSQDLGGDRIAAIPLQSDERMRLICIHSAQRPLSELARRYMELMIEDVQRLSAAAGRP